VTVSFTLVAPADRGPFTCKVKRNGFVADQFPCDVGRVSRTYDFDYCCGATHYISAVDGHGVHSDQWDGWLEFPKPERPVYQNIRGWRDGGVVHIAFDVVSAPGDGPICNIEIFQLDMWFDFREQDRPCAGTTIISFQGVTGPYLVTVYLRSDTCRNSDGGSHTIRVE
jgi:hypothetical protein